MTSIIVPSKLKVLLAEEHERIINYNLIDFSHILNENKLYFFPEYTDHGINHINGVLRSIENLISDDTYDKLSSLDISAIIIATVLHDIGMHTSAEMFRNMIQGKYDNITGNLFKEKTWKELWAEYIKDSRFWNQEKKCIVFGKKDYVIREPNLNNLQSLSEYDRKFIGEFIRNHHARLAYEIALKGYIGNNEPIQFDFSKSHDLNNEKFIQLAGLIARSHNMGVRDTFDYLKPYGKNVWKKPLGIKVIFLMTLIRLADYIQIDASRTDELMLKRRIFYSQYSLREHMTHLAIDCVHFDDDDKEKIVVEASPKDAQMYVKIDNLVKDIQKEFDLSWAILGEIYGNKYKLRYHRIVSNLTDEEVKNGYDFVPNLFSLKFNNKLTELLIKPLYGNNPSYGVRELVQNAVDACRVRMALDSDYNNLKDYTHVTVSLNPDNHLFCIEDTGVGMTIEEIEKYFLTIGSSFDSNIDWQKARDDMNKESNQDMPIGNMIYRTGHFGIGILAAFLLGSKIKVKTKSIKAKPSDKGYEFTLSLEQSVIQISKVVLPNYGTTIEIEECYDQAINILCKQVESSRKGFLGTRKWFGWYIESKPKVEYCYQGKTIRLESQKWVKGFKLLPTTHASGPIYWKPLILFTHENIYETLNFRPQLFCNGFTITDKSNKAVFLIPGVNNYIPHGIPDLKITDVFNQLPLNLQRLNINHDVKYDFEEELAKALCKDLLCQMLAIDIQSFKNIGIFFLHKSGFTINQFGNYLQVMDHNIHYPEKCFNRKTLVHIYYPNYVLPSPSVLYSWKHFISDHPDAFFTFNSSPYEHFMIWSLKTTYDDENRLGLKHLSFASYTKDFSIPVTFPRELVKKIGVSRFDGDSGDYTVFVDDLSNSVFVNDLISQLNSFPPDDRPMFFMIHHVERDDITSSPLDDVINDYAGGDMIVPFEENNRKRKFAKLYEECSEEIELYREIYKNYHLK